MQTEPTPALVLVSVWFAVACMPAGLLMRLAPERWSLLRSVWTIGAAGFLVHTISAYAMVYHWSQTVALEETRRQTAAATGFESGSGLYLNLLFAALWSADAARAWVRPQKIRGQITPTALATHGFFAFMLFNGAFVFVSGPRRWFGLVFSTLVIVLLMVALSRYRARGTSV